MATVAVSTSSFGRHDPAPLDRLRGAGFEVAMNPHGRRLEPAETIALLGNAIGLIAGTELLGAEVLQSAPQLRAISRCGVGMDGIDRAVAARLGIELRRTSEAHVEAVAELALGGLLALLRHIARSDRQLRSGSWHKPMGSLLAGKTVGIVGLGRTGRRFAELLQAFGVQLLAVDPKPDHEAAASLGATFVELEALLAESDVVSLHLEGSPETHHLIDADRLTTMKPGALLVNCARGDLVDEEALLAALDSGHLGGTYLDVFEDEPYSGPLAESDSVVLTPHLGSYAVESRIAMESEAVDNLITALAGRE